MISFRPRDLVALAVLAIAAAVLVAIVPSPPSTPQVAEPVPFAVVDPDQPDPPSDPDYQLVLPGLEIADTREGRGRIVEPGVEVSMDYVMWVEGQSGGPVDQTFDVEPVVAAIGARQLLAGWDAGMQGMRPGGRRVIRMGPDLAFGAAGRPPRIPPNATVIVEVRLRRVTPKGRLGTR